MTTDLDRRRDLRGTLQGALAGGLQALRQFYWRHADVFSVLTLAGFVLVTVAMTFLRPVYNWDVLAYLGTMVKGSATSAAEIHAYAYGVVRDAVPPEAFAALTEAGSYRIRQFADPDAFVSMLGMYEMKWLYISLMKWLTPITGAYESTYVINIAALLILTTSVGLWLRSARLSGYAPLVVALFFVLQFPGFYATQQPDFLGNALLIASLLSYERKRDMQGSVLMLLTILTRPDQIATTGVLMACAWFLRDRSTPIFALTFLAGLIAWFVIGQTTDDVGYWSHVWFSTYQIQDTMVGFHPDFSPIVYLTAIGFNIYRSLFENTWLAAYALGLAWIGALYFRSAIGDQRRQVLVLTALLAIAAKFAVFPLSDGRIYFAQLTILFLLAFAAWTAGMTPTNDQALQAKRP
ncbi:hypothetical protein ASD83_17955 [Devosia sp. Root685]|uniref:hypothetical protein n=1 Tax=Devosia sp. Root685 TaxID=1736587 RepID=UPI0006F6B28F|nr:hypothetical protein [Devosia sp. Root685]KRA95541.1 hypothetical protein ASD83_17955 [Devosia sp. Root685]